MLQTFKPPPVALLANTSICAVLACFGGALFAWLGLPLAWTLGALSVTIAFTLWRGEIGLPRSIRSVFTPLFGVVIGSAFSADLVGDLTHWLSVLALMLVFVTVALFLGVLYFQTVLVVNPVTAYCSAVPGGFSEVILMGPQLGADSQTVVLVQVMRVVVLVFTVPFGFRLMQPELGTLANLQSANIILPVDVLLWLLCAVGGVFLGRRLRLPLYLLTGPMIASTLVYLVGWVNSTPPPELMVVLQLMIGIFAGSRFAGIQPRKAWRVLTASFFWSVILLLLSYLFALLCHQLTGFETADLILALVPGGVQEMTLIALLLGGDVALVSSMHIVRLMIVAGIVLPAWTRLRRFYQPSSGGGFE